jgi:AraC family transcriptional regulator
LALTLPAGEFFGLPRESRGIAGLLLTERVYGPGAYLPPHSHELPYFRLVCQGALTETHRGETRVCPAFSVIFRPPAEVHSERVQRVGARNFIVQFESAWQERLRDYSLVLQDAATFDRGVIPGLAARLYDEFCWMDDVAPLAIEALVLEMVALAARQQLATLTRATPPWLDEARELVQEHFAERLAVSTIAEAVGVHPAHLARAFRQRFHCTIGEYMRRCRVEFARQRLLLTDAPLADIALDAGFCDQGHFCRVFKRLTGLTPAECRTRVRPR